MAAPKKTTKKTTKPAAKKGNVKPSKKNGKVVPIDSAKEESKPKEKKERLPWGKREEVKLVRTRDRLAKSLERFTKAHATKPNKEISDAAVMVKNAVAALTDAAMSLADVDDSYAPRGGGRGKAKVDVGDTVCLTEKARTKYGDLLEEEEFENLKVMKIKGALLIVKAMGTEDQEKFKIRRGEVRLQEQED